MHGLHLYPVLCSQGLASLGTGRVPAASPGWPPGVLWSLLGLVRSGGYRLAWLGHMGVRCAFGHRPCLGGHTGAGNCCCLTRCTVHNCSTRCCCNCTPHLIHILIKIDMRVCACVRCPPCGCVSDSYPPLTPTPRHTLVSEKSKRKKPAPQNQVATAATHKIHSAP